MSTPFDHESIEQLAALGMDYWKIPSGEITNLPYLRHIASKGDASSSRQACRRSPKWRVP